MGYDAGRAYGQRIAPTWVWVDRRYFSNGSPAMREARDRARATDWDGAAKIWRKLARSSDPKVAAKARFNLALYHEVHGRLAKAEDKAVEAAGMLSRASTREYVWVLQRRQADEARLREQMRPPGRRPARGDRAWIAARTCGWMPAFPGGKHARVDRRWSDVRGRL